MSDSSCGGRFIVGNSTLDVVLNQVLVRPPEGTDVETLVASVQKSGTCSFGSTIWNGEPAIRLSVSSWATTDADIETTIAAIAAEIH